MHQIYEVIEKLRQTKSRLDKIDILRKFDEDVDVIRYIKFTYSVFYKFKSPNIKFDKVIRLNGLKLDVLDFMDFIEESALTNSYDGVSLEHKIYELLQYMNPQDLELCEMLLNRDLKCGINKKSINSVWNNLIPEIPFQSAITDVTNNIVFPAMSEKYDSGVFCNIIIKDDEDIKFISENGNEFHISDMELIDQLYDMKIVANSNIVLMGNIKIRYVKTGRDRDKPTLNRVLKQMSNSNNFDYSKYEMYFCVWDIVTYLDWIKGHSSSTYIDRTKLIDTLIRHCILTKISKIEQDPVYSMEDIYDILKSDTPVIIKNYSSIWKDGLSKHWTKLKNS